MLIDVYTIILLFFVGLIAGYLCIILALKLPLRKKEYVNACDHCNHKYKYLYFLIWWVGVDVLIVRIGFL